MAGMTRVGFLAVESNGKLSTAAAVAGFEKAIEYGLVIARVEGGIWHEPGFEARIDCIWDGDEPPVAPNAARRNNRLAAEVVRSEGAVHDVFVITASTLNGW
ncbi:colicin immunity protein [Cupriavidus sp. H18C1]|uniref:colicin immunity protein n=1 Tax=Cupriavidus sp. H18C1 TaxID=3241601 RepID=UPI003BB8F501